MDSTPVFDEPGVSAASRWWAGGSMPRGSVPVRELVKVWGPEVWEGAGGGGGVGGGVVVEDGAEARAVGYCRELASSHQENFSVLSSLVPARLRDDFAAVYAFCRWSDDLGDEYGLVLRHQGSGAGHQDEESGEGVSGVEEARVVAARRLAWWRGELERCWEGSAWHPVFVALLATRRRHPGLPMRPFSDLISAFEQDQRKTRYSTWDEVVDYCTRSADPVGRIVLHLGGYAEGPENGERYVASDATCTALQLTNFWQDVRRDLIERDRVYLPEDETGLRAEHLRAWLDRGDEPGVRVAYIRAVRPMVERTWELFERGRVLEGMLDRSIRPVVWLLGAGGRSTLRRVESIGCATLWDRPRLGKLAKASLVGRALVMSRFGRS